ncbi:hypothetical protein [Mycoplasma wenyonii]|uniref:hypothetical protein n=1 Tax=Mycoplasma wenyonii TaxID=65123 RepID=UPI0002FDFC79|nr:hypothetical protein [Mycoplasma wenyonii]
MFADPNLIKLFIALATGGSPLIYFRVPSDTITRENRKFKWLLNWAGGGDNKKRIN